jgi:mRNA-degrading endonuclease RelE of RelBE toxin-antitoxin system|tara:strand:- start:5752 stop:6177 length:426 start_codon:yes stop_codon:yes gene_type:complete
MSGDEEFKNSSVLISNIADILNEFKKFESLPQKIKNNNNEITILQEEITKINTKGTVDPFNFLKETNNLDLKKKKEVQIREESNNMKEELKKLPETIRDKLSDAIENEKLRIEANNAINEAKNQEKKWKYYRKLRKYLCIL